VFSLLFIAWLGPVAIAEDRPIVVQGAMDSEIQAFAARLTNATVEQIGGWTFWIGTIDGYPVVLSKTNRGMTNAAAATTLAVDHYHPLAIVNQGTAGGHDPGLHLYDIVIGTEAKHLGAFRTPFRALGTGSNALDWTPLDLTVPVGGPLNNAQVRRPAAFAGDAALLEAARSVKTLYTRGRVVEGVLASGDFWNDELDLVARFHREYGSMVEEMETASAAQVAKLLNVPFVGIRVVSDNITNDTAYDPKTGEACEEFVYQVVKAYVSMLKR
jgi:adenosylhomocysteine nucleosidase